MTTVPEKLLGRLLAPTVASVLRKEELCLAMGAVVRLPALHRTGSSGSGAVAMPAQLLASRAQRLAPLCTWKEVSLLSTGSLALDWRHAPVADALVTSMYFKHQQGQDAQPPPRLSEMSSLVDAARAAGRERSYTLASLLLDLGPKLSCSPREDAKDLETFLASCAWCLSPRSMGRLLADIESSCAEGDASKHAVVDRFKESSLVGGPATPEVGSTEWNARRAAEAICSFCESLTPVDNKEVDSANVRAACEAVQLYGRFGIQDPAARACIEGFLVAWLQNAEAPSTHREELMRDVKDAVYGSPALVPSARALLDATMQEGAEGGAQALAPFSQTALAYHDTLRGIRVPAERLVRIVEQEVAHLGPDESAMAACVFAVNAQSVPEVLVARTLSAAQHFSLNARVCLGSGDDHSSGLTPRGVAAVLRASKKSAHPVLAQAADLVARPTSELLQRDGPQLRLELESLLDLCSAVSLPHTRRMSHSSASMAAHNALADALLSRAVATVQSLSAQDALRVAEACAQLDASSAEVVSLACERVCGHSQGKCESTADTAPLVPLLALQLLRTLAAREYTHEASLLAIRASLSPVVRAATSMGSTDATSLAAKEMTVEFAALQTQYDAPELEPLAYTLIHAMETAADGADAYLATAAGLLACRALRPATVQRALGILAAAAKENSSLPCARHVVALLERSVDLCAGGGTAWWEVLSTEAAKMAAHEEQEAAAADTIARCLALICAAHPTNEEPSAALAEVVSSIVGPLRDRLHALSPSSYCALCAKAYTGPLTPHTEFTSEMLAALPGMMDALTPRQIALCVRGLGEVPGAGQRLTDQLATEAIAEYVVDNAELFYSGTDIAYLLKGLALLYCTRRAVYSVFANRLRKRPVIATLDRASISLALSAFGAVKFVDQTLFDRFADVYTRYASTLAAPDLLLALKAFSRVMLLHRGLYVNLGNQVALRVREFPLESQCELLAAYAAVEVPHTKMAAALTQCLAEGVEALGDANKAVDVLTSLWFMQYAIEDDPNVNVLLDRIVGCAADLSGESILKLCSILADSQFDRDTCAKLAFAVADEALRLHELRELSAEAGRAVLDTLGRSQLHHPRARADLSALGKTVSKETVMLSDEEQALLDQLLLR